MRPSIALVVGLLLAGTVHAQGAPPALKLVESVNKKKGQIVFLETVTRAVPVVKEMVVIVNGQQMTVKVTAYEYVQEQRLQSLDLAKCRVITTADKQLPIEDVWNRIKANTVVVVSGDDRAPAAAYLKALNADILIIIPPLAVRIAPPAPQPGKLPPPPKQ